MHSYLSAINTVYLPAHYFRFTRLPSHLKRLVQSAACFQLFPVAQGVKPRNGCIVVPLQKSCIQLNTDIITNIYCRCAFTMNDILQGVVLTTAN